MAAKKVVDEEKSNAENAAKSAAAAADEANQCAEEAANAKDVAAAKAAAEKASEAKDAAEQEVRIANTAVANAKHEIAKIFDTNMQLEAWKNLAVVVFFEKDAVENAKKATSAAAEAKVAALTKPVR